MAFGEHYGESSRYSFSLWLWRFPESFFFSPLFLFLSPPPPLSLLLFFMAPSYVLSYIFLSLLGLQVGTGKNRSGWRHWDDSRFHFSLATRHSLVYSRFSIPLLFTKQGLLSLILKRSNYLIFCIIYLPTCKINEIYCVELLTIFNAISICSVNEKH